MHNQYDEDYYLRGKETGKSLYTDYRWLPDLTIPMAKRIAEHLGMQSMERVFDFGCARGYLIKAFIELGMDAEGIDASEWAVQNADPSIRKCVRLETTVKYASDWIIAKDVLEHLSPKEVMSTLHDFARFAGRGVFIVVPLADGDEYAVPEYEQDITHVIRWSLEGWVAHCHHAFDERWEISSRYRIEGIKDNYAHFPKGNGFITCRRIG